MLTGVDDRKLFLLQSVERKKNDDVHCVDFAELFSRLRYYPKFFRFFFVGISSTGIDDRYSNSDARLRGVTSQENRGLC